MEGGAAEVAICGASGKEGCGTPERGCGERAGTGGVVIFFASGRGMRLWTSNSLAGVFVFGAFWVSSLRMSAGTTSLVTLRALRSGNCDGRKGVAVNSAFHK